MLIFRNFLLVRSDNWPRKWRVQTATAKHIRQVAGNLPVAQIQLMHHQHTELLTRNYNQTEKDDKAKAAKPQTHRTTNIKETL